MLLHELATNAIKHGALSDANGRLRLTWKVVVRNRRSILDLRWEERGGPPVNSPAHTGFGTTILERGIPGAEVTREFRPEGVICHLRVPLRSPLQQRSRSVPALEDDQA